MIARYYSLQPLCNHHSKHPLQVAGEGVVRRGKAINVSNVQVYTGFKTGLARAKYGHGLRVPKDGPGVGHSAN